MTDSQARAEEPAEVGASTSVATETTPLLQHASDFSASNTGLRITDEEQAMTSGLIEPPQPSRPGRLLAASQRYMLLGGIAAVILGMAVVILGDLHPRGYNSNWFLMYYTGWLTFIFFITLLWALANLAWLRYTARVLPCFLGVVVHFFLAMYTTGLAVNSIYEMAVHPPSCYYSSGPDERERCSTWRSLYHILVWSYLVVALVLSLTHVVLFFTSCIATYLSVTVPPSRAVGADSPAAARGHVGVLIPSGQLTFEFSAKLFRWQDATPAAVGESPNTGTA
ncbi:hypothetical protein B0T22DRAFT_271111 [Podospora appendiculata]|uniref:Uncharacterized protein n=1 Tax=Podospora appendiculata TaxID=314037 RepID=A0AAE0X3S9_9PEZI|nr:hypothetical protein B0T22DRAFT_271111 [Podospora appendiculata]